MVELRTFNPELDGIKLFMNPYEDELSFDLDAIPPICQVLHVQTIDEVPEKESAWLDDLLDSESQVIPPTVATRASNRYIPSSRRYLLPLTAHMLYIQLDKKRFNHPSEPDADRRLVYIANPAGSHICAIIETTPQHQHEAVRVLIARFFSFETSIKASLATTGQPTYRLECHLPYFAWRRTQSPPKETTVNPHREWIDLSFLAHVLLDPGDETFLGIHPAQVSVVLCGTSETRYMVHCFEDTRFDEDRDMGQDEFSDTGFQADQIAKGKTDANIPIWNPREYFLHVLLIRINQIRDEWTRVVRNIESAFQTFSSGRLHFAKSHCDPVPHNNIEAASYWTQQMLQLLSKLLQKIEETNYAWDCFLGGDVGYFSDLDSVSPTTKFRIELMLQQVDEAFSDLKGLQKRLERVQTQCEKKERFLEVRLVMDSHKNTELTIVYICPVTVVSTFFAIPTPIMSFERNARSFFGAILVITAIIWVLRIFRGERFRQQPWLDTITSRAKAAWQGDRTNTTKNALGQTVIRRRRTHPWVQEPKDL
ncbi:hypothetical protein BKA66DRAFT_539677 [Pyrenochaeta sp. MPI-SDFR-AT-0127]|nr:hypothetical protein BKA66DRAFT_539677 [Pyrenochaeta sp. MPI-SDFR-AT-0127]